MINNNATNSTILLFTFNNIQGRGLQSAIEQQLGQPVLLAKGAEVELPHYRDEHYMAIVDSSLPDLSEVKMTLSELEHVDATVLVNAEPIWAWRACSLGQTSKACSILKMTSTR